MTDLQRHLKGIHKILSNSIADTSAKLDLVSIRETLRAYLPASYGIGQGVITDGNLISDHIDFLLYDRPLANGLYNEHSTTFKVEHVLLILGVANQYSQATFQDALQRMASVKRLDTQREIVKRPQNKPLGQQRTLIPKDRLPFALLFANEFENYSAENAQLFDDLLHLLDSYPIDQRPDHIELIGQAVQMRNVLLERTNSYWYDIGISKLPDLKKPEPCYVCRQRFFRRHFHYENLCIPCGDQNYHKRIQQVDLADYRVLITGARVKIGYKTALRLLRAGAEVIATSRFPHSMAQRYAQEPDFDEWGKRLHIYGLDLRQLAHLELFIQHLYENYSHIDCIINNAAQTVKRPPQYYAHLLPAELSPLEQLPSREAQLLRNPSEHRTFAATLQMAQLEAGEPLHSDFPHGEFDDEGQQIDNRDYNSWIMRLDEVPPQEFLEVHIVNAIAPAILTGQLKDLLMKSPHAQRLVINVSSAEGRFAQHKNGLHPHTNMAKASLNMLTRSIAKDFKQSNIIVTSVDPGWVSDQVPRTNDESRAYVSDLLPIDMLDAAARICDPLFSLASNDVVQVGVLYKDYRVVDW